MFVKQETQNFSCKKNLYGKRKTSRVEQGSILYQTQ